MPAGDGSGPMGMGPMTGRAAGYCAGYGVPGYMNAAGGRGMGFGRGRGAGFGRGMGMGFRGGRGRGGWGQAVPYAVPPASYARPAYVGPTAEQERDALTNQVSYLEETLEGIRSRLAELEAGNDAKK